MAHASRLCHFRDLAPELEPEGSIRDLTHVGEPVRVPASSGKSGEFAKRT